MRSGSVMLREKSVIGEVDMLHNELFDMFKRIAKIPDENIDCWFPNGKDSVRVRLVGGLELVLTYKSMTMWRLETVDSFLK
jgi:hypothetical protein